MRANSTFGFQEGRDWSFGLDETDFAADLAKEYGNATDGGSSGVNISEMLELYTQPPRPSTVRA